MKQDKRYITETTDDIVLENIKQLDAASVTNLKIHETATKSIEIDIKKYFVDMVKVKLDEANYYKGVSIYLERLCKAIPNDADLGVFIRTCFNK